MKGNDLWMFFLPGGPHKRKRKLNFSRSKQNDHEKNPRELNGLNVVRWQ
jgi:hypothetical protein